MIGTDRTDDRPVHSMSNSFAGQENAIRAKFGRTAVSGDEILFLAAAEIARSCTFEEKAYGGSAAMIEPSDR